MQSNIQPVIVGIGIAVISLFIIYLFLIIYSTHCARTYDTRVKVNSIELLSTFKDHNIVPIDPFSYIKIRGKVFTNRIIKAATYEALCDLEGIPLKGLVDFHQKMARGGSGMSIVAYGAISAPGRSFPAQLICREKSIPMMTSVTNAIHSEGRLACIQLTHAGYFSDPALSELPPIHEQMSAQSIFNPAKFCFCREMSGEDRQKVCNDFVEAAKVAVRAGFDCLEIHCGHGYLLSQYLSPRLNPGKSLMERLAYPCLILRNIRNAIKDTAVLMVKMNLIDGMEGGISVQESCEIAKAFASCGVDIIALSGGLILENGLFMLRGEVPLSNMIAATPDPMKRLALQIFGPIVIPKLAYKEMFFREPALCVRSALHTWNSTTGMEVGHRVAVCMMGGVQDLDSLVKATQHDGFDFIQSGRATLRDADIVRRWKVAYRSRSVEKDNDTAAEPDSVVSLCTKCNHCIIDATMRQKPISCVEW